MCPVLVIAASAHVRCLPTISPRDDALQLSDRFRFLGNLSLIDLTDGPMTFPAQHQGVRDAAAPGPWQISRPSRAAKQRNIGPRVLHDPPDTYGTCSRIRLGSETDNVLVVDDVTGIRVQLLKLLETKSCRVIIADTIREAMKCLRDEVVHCVVCDAGKDAEATLGMVRDCKADARLMHVPILVLHAGGCRDLAAQCLAASPDDCLDKTEGWLDEIAARVANLIANRRRIFGYARIVGGYAPASSSRCRWSIDSSDLSSQEGAFLARIEDAVEQNYRRATFDAIALANELKLERRQLERLCQRLLGVTPSGLIRTVRLIHAWFLLKTGEAVKAVRSLVGYPPHGDFKDHFTSCFGITPLEMKRIVSGIC